MSHSIEIKEVGKNFGKKTVLDKISVVIEEGEIFGLLGPSGAGKTTLIKILTGQLQASSGSAKVLGVDTLKIDNVLYTNFGMVLDNTGLYERLSCYDNLALFAQIYGIHKSKIMEVLQKVGLETAKKQPVNKLSKGMKQRLVLARAIMHNPKILFLDEPTSGLDPKTAFGIHELIMEQKKRGTTIFLTTHNMEEATKLCDHVALLCEGSMIEYGKPKDICRKYNEQNRIQILLKDGEIVNLQNGSDCAERIAMLFAENNVESIHSSEPNLETVFMDLTGRKLGE